MHQPAAVPVPLSAILSLESLSAVTLGLLALPASFFAADNVFVNIKVAVQYQILNDDQSLQNAQYRLTNPQQQIESYVFGVLEETNQCPFAPALPNVPAAASTTAAAPQLDGFEV